MKRGRGRRQLVWWGLSALIVLSMLCSLAVLVRPVPPPLPTATLRPTEAPPTETPTPTPTSALAVAPAPSPNAEFTFAVAGDSRGGEAIFKQVLQQVASERPAFLVHTGDLVSTGLEQEFEAFQGLIADLPVPFYPVPGNHDSSGGRLDGYLKYSGAPAEHYALDYGRAHLAFVDSHQGRLSPQETAWLDADLAATAQPLKIVVLHYPPFDPRGSSHVMAGGNEAFMQLIERRGVGYVFAGHIHAYAAGERNGVTYVISGGAGAPLYGAEAQGGYHHYLRVQVRGTELTYEVVRVEPVATTRAVGAKQLAAPGRAAVEANRAKRFARAPA